MAPYTDAVITGLIAALVCTLILSAMRIRHMKEQRKWEKIAQDSYLQGRGEFSEFLRETCDKIQEDRNSLAGKTETELLTQILLTLGSYGRRMDRMEDKLKILSHYKAYTKDMGEKAVILDQSFLQLEQDVRSTASTISELRSTIQETGSRIHALTEALSGMEPLQTEIRDYASRLADIRQTLADLQEETAQIVRNMETVVDTNRLSPVQRLKNIEMEITGLNMLVKRLGDSLETLSDETGRMGAHLDSSRTHARLEQIVQSLDALQQQLDAASRQEDSE